MKQYKSVGNAVRGLRKKWNKSKDFEKEFQSFEKYFDPPFIGNISNRETRYQIIKYYITSADKTILSYLEHLEEEDFSMEQFEVYKIYKSTRRCISPSDEFLKAKYGARWETYKQRLYTRTTNPFVVADQMKKHGLSREEAQAKVDDLKGRCVNTVEKYIAKFGEEQGPIIFKKNCRRHKNYLEYWDKKYPNDPATALEEFNKYKRTTSVKCEEFYIKNGHTADEAKQLISSNQLASAGVHRAYYEKLGMDPDKIDEILTEINSRKDSSSIEFFRASYPDMSKEEILEMYNEHSKTKSKSFRERGFLKKDDPELDAKIAYYCAVQIYTNRHRKYLPERPGTTGRSAGDYHVDHMYSIYQGWLDKISPEIIGDIVNLRWLIAKENSAKGANCAMTKEELLVKYTTRKQ